MYVLVMVHCYLQNSEVVDLMPVKSLLYGGGVLLLLGKQAPS